MPCVSDDGACYMPETLFDRNLIYVWKDRRERCQNNYRSAGDWIRLDPKDVTGS